MGKFPQFLTDLSAAHNMIMAGIIALGFYFTKHEVELPWEN